MTQILNIRTNCESCSYITPGKIYEARVLDHQIALKTRLPGSSHLNGQSWEVLQDC